MYKPSLTPTKPQFPPAFVSGPHSTLPLKFPKLFFIPSICCLAGNKKQSVSLICRDRVRLFVLPAGHPQTDFLGLRTPLSTLEQRGAPTGRVRSRDARRKTDNGARASLPFVLDQSLRPADLACGHLPAGLGRAGTERNFGWQNSKRCPAQRDHLII